MKKAVAVTTIIAATFVLCFMKCVSGGKSEVKSRLCARMDSIMNERYEHDAPGGALLIAKDGEILYDSGRGVADMNSKEKIDGNTAFNIASISKQFTAIGVLKLQEEGKLNVDDCITKYFPDLKKDFWKSVKLKHLLSHCSGVPDKRPREDRNFVYFATDEQSIQYMKDLDGLKFEAGTEYDYINPTFDLFYVILGRLSGLGFEEYQKRNIFDVAGMDNVRYFSPDKIIPHMAHGYIVNEEAVTSGIDSDSSHKREVVENDYVDAYGVHWAECDYGEETFFATKADGGIYTSTHDFLKWENALWNNKIVNEGLKNQAYSKHIKVTGSPYCTYQNRPNTYYGYGWFIDTMPGRETKVYHTGDNGGFQAYAAKYLDSKVNVIMFENRNDLDRWSLQMDIERILKEEGLIK